MGYCAAVAADRPLRDEVKPAPLAVGDRMLQGARASIRVAAAAPFRSAPSASLKMSTHNPRG